MSSPYSRTESIVEPEDIGRFPRVALKTDNPIAVNSVDHLYPLGTMQDNFRSPAFTNKLIDLYSGLPMTVLDIGCAGGGFVKEVNEFGFLGVGLEGSDYSLRHRRAEWATIPDRLFTCDCTKPFSLSFEETEKKSPAKFDVVTAWEFLEHIKEEDLSTVFENVASHLNPETGIFVASVHLHSCESEGHEYHATVKPEWWWRDVFRKHGFYIIDRALDYFDEDWVRGYQDDQDAIGTCHIVGALRHDSEIVQRIDRAACSSFEHGHVVATELRRIAKSAFEKIESLEGIVQHQAQGFVEISLPQLPTVAAHVVARCRAEQWKHIALYGAGSHSAMLIPLLRSLGGPSIESILVSRRNEDSFDGIPLVEVGKALPALVQAIVPSSHQSEASMKLAARAAYPKIPWVFLWNPDEELG